MFWTLEICWRVAPVVPSPTAIPFGSHTVYLVSLFFAVCSPVYLLLITGDLLVSNNMADVSTSSGSKPGSATNKPAAGTTNVHKYIRDFQASKATGKFTFKAGRYVLTLFACMIAYFLAPKWYRYALGLMVLQSTMFLVLQWVHLHSGEIGSNFYFDILGIVS